MAETAAQFSREQKALQVMQLTCEGSMTVKNACTEVGVSRSAYYAFLKHHGAWVEAVQEEMISTSRDLLCEILVSRVELLQKVIEDGLRDDTKVMERLRIFQETEKMLNSLAATLRLDSRANLDAALDVLSGPVFEQGVSRFTAAGQ